MSEPIDFQTMHFRTLQRGQRYFFKPNLMPFSGNLPPNYIKQNKREISINYE